MRFRIFPEPVTLRRPPVRSGKEWCRRWNRTLSTIFAVIAFICLMVYVIYNIIDTNGACGGCYKRRFKTEEVRNFNPSIKSSKCHKISCSVTCTEIAETDSLTDHINLALAGSLCTIITELKIVNGQFKNSTIENQWISSNVKPIMELTILNCFITELGQQVFDGSPFQQLKKLMIINTEIRFLRNGTFMGMKSITDFAFRFDDPTKKKTLTVEKQALSGMENSIQTLQFNYCLDSAESLLSISGVDGVPLPYVQLIDYSLNFLPELKSGSFVNTPGVISVYLNLNKIATMEKNTFQGITSITSLYINNNNLQTIPDGIFDTLQCRGLYAANNPWFCNCGLKWFQDYYINDCVNKDPPLVCSNHNDECFEYVDFGCNETTTATSEDTTTTPLTTTTAITITPSRTTTPLTTTTTGITISTPTTTELTTTTTAATISTTRTTTKLTTTSTTNNPNTTTSETTPTLPPNKPKLIPIICRNYAETPLKISDQFPREQLQHNTIEVKPESLHFEFSEVVLEEGFKVEVKITGNTTGYNIMWYSNNNFSQNSCIMNGREIGYMEDVTRNTTYTVCVIHKEEYLVSPFHCMGLTTQAEWGYRTWINNRSIGLTIGIVILTLFFISIFTGLTVFFCIRQHPNMIKGNKNVIIVQKQTGNTMNKSETPKEYDKPAYEIRSVFSNNSSSYLEPVDNRIYSAPKFQFPVIKSISNYAQPSNSYITTLDRIRDYGSHSTTSSIYQGRPTTFQEAVQIERPDLDEVPPPLPPGHPMDRWNRSESSPNSCSSA